MNIFKGRKAKEETKSSDLSIQHKKSKSADASLPVQARPQSTTPSDNLTELRISYSTEIDEHDGRSPHRKTKELIERDKPFLYENGEIVAFGNESGLSLLRKHDELPDLQGRVTCLEDTLRQLRHENAEIIRRNDNLSAKMDRMNGGYCEKGQRNTS